MDLFGTLRSIPMHPLAIGEPLVFTASRDCEVLPLRFGVLLRGEGWPRKGLTFHMSCHQQTVIDKRTGNHSPS